MWLQLDPWVTEHGSNPLPLEEEHCTAMEVTEEEVQNSVRLITSLSTVVSRLFKLPIVKYLSCKIHFMLSALRPVCQVKYFLQWNANDNEMQSDSAVTNVKM